MIGSLNEQNYKKLKLALNRLYFSLLASVLSACGGSKTGEIRNGTDIGFSPDYVPPDANFDPPSGADPQFRNLKANIR